MISYLDSGVAPFSARAIAIRLRATMAAFGVDPEMFALTCDIAPTSVSRALDGDEDSVVEVCGPLSGGSRSRPTGCCSVMRKRWRRIPLLKVFCLKRTVQ